VKIRSTPKDVVIKSFCPDVFILFVSSAVNILCILNTVPSYIVNKLKKEGPSINHKPHKGLPWVLEALGSCNCFQSSDDFTARMMVGSRHNFMEPTVIKHHDDLVGWFDVYTLALKSVTHNYHSVTVLGSTMCQGEGFHCM
jgi:hypothetical protein